MRTLLLSIAIGSCATAHSQNWALLNSTYKYNYSNDGSDTISNQIFVTYIDTLGVDSFRYELNRIGVQCDTCPESIGGPCDGCYVRINQPQFLGFSAIKTGENYYFLGTDTFMIKGAASLGISWVFDPNSGVTATMDAEWEGDLFNTNDSLRRILLSNGDTLLLSRSFGILQFGSGDERYVLLGVEGAGVGRLFPDPLAYFDYQPGDQLTYRVTAVWWATPPGGPQFPQTYSHYWMAVITGRTETPDAVEYSTSVARTYPFSQYPGSLLEEPDWPMPLDQWSFHRSDVLADHPIVAAYPGQVIDHSICWQPNEYSAPRILVSYGITSDGRAIVHSQGFGQLWGSTLSGFDAAQELAPDVFPIDMGTPLNAWYEEGIGIRKVELRVQPGLYEVSVVLVGAIINGDTVIAPPLIEWGVGLHELEGAQLHAYPDPASESISLVGLKGNETLTILDLEGRGVKTARITRSEEVIDVHDLKVGMYVLHVEGLPPQRVVIAR